MTQLSSLLQQEIEGDFQYTICMITGERGTTENPIEWHQVRLNGEAIERAFCIVSILQSVRQESEDAFVQSRLEWIVLNRASDAELVEFSNGYRGYKDLFQRRALLNKTFGVWRSPVTTKIVY